MSVVDASALLAFVRDEPGGDIVEDALLDGAACSAANWSEVAQKVLAAERDWSLVRTLLQSYDLDVVAVTVEDAEWAAHGWQPGQGLSLGDRLCLALAARLEEQALTADQSWGTDGRVRQIR